MDFYGARGRNRTGTPLPARDFKSLVSTDFTNRASESSTRLRRRWRRVPESNRTRRICNPLHNRFVNAPFEANLGAGNETRTRDPDLGKVVLYQLSYSRIAEDCLTETGALYVEKPDGQNNFYRPAFNRLAIRQPPCIQQCDRRASLAPDPRVCRYGSSDSDRLVCLGLASSIHHVASGESQVDFSPGLA